MRRTAPTTAACLFLLVLPLGTADDDLRFAVSEGTVVRKTLTERADWKLESLLQRSGGMVLADEAPPLTAALDRVVVAFDEYGEVANGAPKTFTRTFDEVLVATDVDAEVQEVPLNFHAELTSDLVGEPIRFTLDGDGDYEATFEDEGAGDAARLDPLLADMDLLAILPDERFEDGEVEEGDVWTLDDDALLSLLCPGGGLPLAALDVEGEWEIIQPSDVLAMTVAHLGETARAVEGEVTFEWTETIEEDGRRLARLGLTFDGSADADLGERLREVLETADVEDEREDMTLETGLVFDGTGEVLWDLGAGRAHSMRARAEAEITVEMTWLQDVRGQKLEFLGEYGLLGAIELELAVERR